MIFAFAVSLPCLLMAHYLAPSHQWVQYMQVRRISDSTQHTLVLSPYIIFTCEHEESQIFNEFLNIRTLLGAFFSSCHISHLVKKSGWRQTPIKSWSQTSARISDQNSQWLEPYEFHCGEVRVALGKVENSGDVTPSQAPHPLPVSTATFHEDIFSSVVFANTDKAAAEYYTFLLLLFPPWVHMQCLLFN